MFAATDGQTINTCPLGRARCVRGYRGIRSPLPDERAGLRTSRADLSLAAQLYLATVPASEGTDPHSSWVSYYQTNAHGTNWQHKTTYILPAHSKVTVTIYQFDGDSGLRNPFISQATGTVGGTFLLNGKPTVAIDPDTASHVFAVPQLGLSVPLQGVDDNAKNQCANAPCSLKNAHQTITFTFRDGGQGPLRWQCFVPCAAGYIDGFGGPMQTVGYMDGFLKVV